MDTEVIPLQKFASFIMEWILQRQEAPQYTLLATALLSGPMEEPKAMDVT